MEKLAEDEEEEEGYSTAGRLQPVYRLARVHCGDQLRSAQRLLLKKKTGREEEKATED